MNKIVSRKEAIAAGLKFYFTGKLCPSGHTSKRRVADHSCRECEKVKTHQYVRRGYPAPTRECPAACELCGKPPKKRALHLDHDHKTNTFRGWLCTCCNTALGKFGDNVQGILDAALYLRRASTSLLPTEAAKRKAIPLATGLFDYFSSALIEIAKVSYAGNEQHNPGQPLHWARGKSMDHSDTLQRHFAERGTVDTDGHRHSAKMAWRALALLQMELEEAGYPKARGAK